MHYDKINGVEKKISKLIMGNDNQTEFDSAAKLWDHWISVGGNTFDNAHHLWKRLQWKLLWVIGKKKEIYEMI